MTLTRTFISLWMAATLALTIQPAQAALGCFGQCETQRTQCTDTLRGANRCDATELLCRERCDPKKLSPAWQRDNTQANAVIAQRERPADRLRVCAQNCDLTARSCTVAGNRAALCQMGRSSCLERCQ